MTHDLIAAIEKVILAHNKETGNVGDEALDGDEVDVLVARLKNYINYSQGNITTEEYEELEGIITTRDWDNYDDRINDNNDYPYGEIE